MRLCVQAGNRALQNAGSVLVIGAGPAGVETAAEIAKAVPGKLVTVVGSKSTVLGPGVPPAMTQHVEWWLRNHGVKVCTAGALRRCLRGGHHSFA